MNDSQWDNNFAPLIGGSKLIERCTHAQMHLPVHELAHEKSSDKSIASLQSIYACPVSIDCSITSVAVGWTTIQLRIHQTSSVPNSTEHAHSCNELQCFFDSSVAVFYSGKSILFPKNVDPLALNRAVYMSWSCNMRSVFSFYQIE